MKHEGCSDLILHSSSYILHPVGSGGGIRTRDLRVMSPTSYRCSTPRRDGPGGGLLSHRVAPAVSSALGRFTAVFGMGTGGAAPRWPPGPRLVRVGSGHVGRVRSWGPGAGPRGGGEPLGRWGRSAARVAALRRAAHRPPGLGGALRPRGSGGPISERASRLDAVSAYHGRTAATRRCPWRDNRSTGGPSAPVLSYWGRASSAPRRPRRIETELSHDVLNPARVPL